MTHVIHFFRRRSVSAFDFLPEIKPLGPAGNLEEVKELIEEQDMADKVVVKRTTLERPMSPTTEVDWIYVQCICVYDCVSVCVCLWVGARVYVCSNKYIHGKIMCYFTC